MRTTDDRSGRIGRAGILIVTIVLVLIGSSAGMGVVGRTGSGSIEPAGNGLGPPANFHHPLVSETPSRPRMGTGPVPTAVPSATLQGTCTAVPPGAGYIAYDPNDNMTYATDTGSVAVINQTCNIAGYISLPSGALSQRLAYDAANRQMYVTDSVLSKIYEIHGFKVTRVISNVPGAFGITYDPDINGVAVFGYNGNAIYFLVGNHSRLNVSLGAYRAWSIAYSPLVHALAISAVARHCQNGTCQWAERLFLLNSTTGNATHFGFGQPLYPGVSVVDSTSGYLYACESGGYVFVFNLSHPVSTVKRIALTGLSPSCQGLAYSPHNDTVFAVSGTSGTVYGIQGVTLSTQFSIPGGSSLWAVTYDPATHSLYATTGGPVDKIFVVRE